MLFNSWQFAMFLPITFLIYWLLPHRFRWAILLLTSCCFYCVTGARYFPLLMIVTIGSYLAGRMIERSHENRKKTILLVSVVCCLLILTVYKYLGFLVDSLAVLLRLAGLTMHPVTIKLLLPLGISFYLFNVIGYLIDVSKGRVEAEKHLGIYALYVTFFPKMLAGPIERAGNLIPQLKQELKFDSELGIDGLKRMLWGFFKKIVVADTLAIYVDAVYDNMTAHTGFALLLAAIFFSIQIYCDFSGYSDIAIGTAELFGFRLMENFQSPYFSSNIKEFWSRWHISLSTWFRDYVYIPLGGNRVSKPRQYWNLMVTFLTSGLWHGANWTFVLWGGLHGAMQVLEKMIGIRTYKKRDAGWLLRCCLVFLFATAAWVFFRANTIGDAFYLLTHFLTGLSSPASYIRTGFKAVGMTSGALVNCILFMVLLCWYDLVSGLRNRDAREVLSEKKAWVQWLVYVVIGLFVVFLSQKGVAAEFVYMQF